MSYIERIFFKKDSIRNKHWFHFLKKYRYIFVELRNNIHTGAIAKRSQVIKHSGLINI